MTTATETLEDLRAQVRRHNHLYYLANQPEISDEEYDNIVRRIRQLEAELDEPPPANSPTVTVGTSPAPGMATSVHPAPMLSLGNITNAKAFQGWRRSRSANREGKLTAEAKIDGIAIRLEYRDGELALAVTRGDGAIGEVVTQNVRRIADVPQLINQRTGGLLGVRGEIFMPRSGFEIYNAERQERGEEPLTNPRNAAAGAVRHKDPNETGRRPLGFHAYTLENPPEGIGTQADALAYMARLGLPTNPLTVICADEGEALRAFTNFEEQRDRLDYDIDGVVFKVNSLRQQEEAGATSHEPRWAIAWKFASQRAVTRLRRISISQGRFGRLTPVAELEPVNIGGVVIERASLHNETDTRRKDIREGARVTVERAGDVIPQVTGPATPAANNRLPAFKMPAGCPDCGAKVETRHGETGHWCPNQGCAGRLPAQIRSLVGRDGMDVDGIGTVMCDAIAAAPVDHDENRPLEASSPAKLYLLRADQLAALPGSGPKNGRKLKEQLDACRERPLANVLYALGVERMGRSVCRALAARYSSVDQVLQEDASRFEQMDGIGPKIADSMRKGLASNEVRATVEIMRRAGVRAIEGMGDPPPGQATAIKQKDGENLTIKKGPFEGENVVVTGKITNLTRVEAESIIRQKGGETSSTVNGKTTLLVVGEKPGSKLKKAMDLNIPVINEEEFLNRLHDC